MQETMFGHGTLYRSVTYELLCVVFILLLQSMSGACLFLAAKVEEQPRKLEHVIRTGYMCTHRDQPALDVKSDVSAR